MKILKLLFYHLASIALIAIIAGCLTTIGDYIICFFKGGGCQRYNAFQRFLFYVSYYFLFSYFTFFFLTQILLSFLHINAKLNTWKVVTIGLMIGIAFSSATNQYIMPLIKFPEKKMLYSIAVTAALIAFVLVNKRLWALFKLEKDDSVNQ